MVNTYLLDCTLRDGGYVNNWNFGKGTVSCIYNRLSEAKVDIIEIGFLDDRQLYNENRTIQPTTHCYSEIYKKEKKSNSKIVAMIDYGTCNIDNIENCDETILDGIRLIFKIDKIDGALAYAEQLIQKGYEVCLQLVSITSYSDDDLLSFIERANKITPFAVSIVDTYGLLHKEQLLHYFEILNDKLNKKIIIGYHSHNNFQLGYSNAIEFLNCVSDHDKIIDGTLYGMGKSAGNAPLELIARYMNQHMGKRYDIDQIMEAIDNNILNIYKEKYWGYAFLYYISAIHDCHPNYVSYLLNKETLPVSSINKLLNKIEGKYKLNYNSELIEKLYHDFQSSNVENNVCFSSLSKDLMGRELLVLGPGKSIRLEEKCLLNYILQKRPIIISANFIPESICPDYVLITNAKRYNMIYSDILDIHDKVIATSNVTPVCGKFRYIFNYAELVSDLDPCSDSALTIMLNLLIKLGIIRVNLAGFDGFTSNYLENYFDDGMTLSHSKNYNKINDEMQLMINKKREEIEITFLTSSRYE